MTHFLRQAPKAHQAHQARQASQATKRHPLQQLCTWAAALLLCTGLFTLTTVSHAQEAPKVKIATNLGDIQVELYPDKAPKTVANFLQYVKDKHYNGTIFHRVIANFMIQGGGYDAQYKERATRAPVQHEGRQAMAAGLKNQAGYLAMARTNDPQSATAQFFINTVDNAFLDPVPIPEGDPVKRFEYRSQVYENVPRENLLNALQLFGYTVFGKVTSGMDVVDKIRATPTGMGGPFRTDVPKTPVVILSITLVQ